ncbi:hypothetical protein ACXM2N_03435 [Corynebacterium sp. ZY180755]
MTTCADYLAQHPLPWKVFEGTTVLNGERPTAIQDANGNPVIEAINDYGYGWLEGAQELVNFVNSGLLTHQIH